MKKTRFDLQRAVNTPVNAISPVNSAHLCDKLLRLRSLLRGERVEVQGKQVTAQSVPQGITFCKNLVAKMIAVGHLSLHAFFHWLTFLYWAHCVCVCMFGFGQKVYSELLNLVSLNLV